MDESAQTRTMNAALSGLRVLDLSQFDAGASCAETLAWLGADVVKVEELKCSASARYATTERPGVDSYDFILLNANKRSIACDFESEHGKKQLRQLIGNADVLVENMSPGVMERLGFDYDAVRQLNPQLIFAQIRGFASDGARASYLSSDVIAQSVGGALYATGYEGGPPLKCGPTIGDTGAGLNCVIGILAALNRRQMTGHGQRLEVNMQDAVINLHRIAYVSPMRGGVPQARTGNGSRTASAPSNLFACKPGGANDYVFIHVAKSADKHWHELVKVMGRDELKDSRYSTAEGRYEHRGEINAIVSEWCRQHTKIEVMEAMQPRVPAAAVLDAKDLSEDDHLHKRGMFVMIEHPVRGQVTMPAWPVKMSDSYVPVVSAPLLGEHTEQVVSEWLTSSRKKMDQPQRQTPITRVQLERTSPALSGVRILDLTQFESGPSCTQILAWLGADVVKVEEPKRGERGRFNNTDKEGVDANYFLLLNSNKRSVICDIKSDAGKKVLIKLITHADVMVENMAPGVIERLGFGYDVVRQLNPGIIYAQIKGFAQDGPRARYLCFDTIAEAAGGSMASTGTEAGSPLNPGPNLGDTGGGMHCAAGVLAALYQRHITGRGQRIEVAMQEVVLNFNRLAFASYLATGKPPRRPGNRSLTGVNAPQGVYPCQGGGPNDYCVIYTPPGDNEQWQRLLRAIGSQDLIDDARFATPERRVRHADKIDELLCAWCNKRTKIEAMEVLQSAGVQAGAVLDTHELSADAQLHKSGMFVTVEHAVRGPVTIPASPIKIFGCHVPVRSAPLLGAHTDEVLAEWADDKKEH